MTVLAREFTRNLRNLFIMGLVEFPSDRLEISGREHSRQLYPKLWASLYR